MKPFNESDLIAYHLHELPPRRARALEAAIQSDPALAAESNAYATMLHAFKDSTPFEVDEDTMDRNWSRINARLPIAPLRPPLFSRWLVPTAAGLAFAATAFFVATRTTQGPALPSPSSPSPNDVTRAVPPSQDEVPPANTTQNHPGTGHDTSRPTRTPFTLSPAASLIARLHDAPPRILPEPDSEDATPMLQYIPLAHAPILSSTQAPAMADNAPQQITPAPHNGGKQKQSHNYDPNSHYMEVTLAMGDTLIGTREVSDSNGQLRTQGATHALSAIGSFHQQIRPAIGYRFTASYNRPHYRYLDHFSSNGAVGQEDVAAHVYSFAGTYVVQGPHHGNVSTTAEAGTALIAFLPLPDANGSTGGANVRPAAVLGVGAEIGVTKHIAINAGYRLQIFKGPDFRSSNAGLPQITTTLVSNEPSVGISYRFAHK